MFLTTCDYPIPEPEALVRSNTLSQLLQTREQRRGTPLPFSEWMHSALYEPALGYYTTHTTIGRDFITAPELTSRFGQCIAAFVHHGLANLKYPAILELGPGNGTLACDVLSALDQMGNHTTPYFLNEISPTLRVKQSERLQSYETRVQWITEIPHDFEGVIIANEILDALPVERFLYKQGICLRGYVSYQEDAWQWSYLEEQDPKWHAALSSCLPYFKNQSHYCSEYAPAISTYIQQIGERLRKGTVLFIDYGMERAELYHPQRNEGTLRSFYQHRITSDVLQLPGLQDITAHVDFTHVGKAALAAGFSVQQFTTQAEFLMQWGILNPPTIAASARTQYTEAQALKQLLMPQEMGALIKVMVLQR